MRYRRGAGGTASPTCRSWEPVGGLATSHPRSDLKRYATSWSGVDRTVIRMRPAVDPPLTLSGWMRYDVVRRRLRKRPIRSVLEIGPGVGALGVRLARDYDYTGVEIDPVSAEIARRNLAEHSSGTILTGAPDDIEDQFDLV